MPLYEVEHYLPFSEDEKQALAQSITNIHSRIFTTPSIFVNVRFMSAVQSQNQNFVGGKKVSGDFCSSFDAIGETF